MLKLPRVFYDNPFYAHNDGFPRFGKETWLRISLEKSWETPSRCPLESQVCPDIVRIPPVCFSGCVCVPALVRVRGCVYDSPRCSCVRAPVHHLCERTHARRPVCFCVRVCRCVHACIRVCVRIYITCDCVTVHTSLLLCVRRIHASVHVQVCVRVSRFCVWEHRCHRAGSPSPTAPLPSVTP